MFTPTHPFQLVLGLIIWSAWFVLIYAVLSVGCSFSPPTNITSPMNWINGLLVVLTIITTLLLTFFSRRCWRARAIAGNSGFTARVAACVYLIGAVSTLAIGIPVLVLPPCV